MNNICILLTSLALCVCRSDGGVFISTVDGSRVSCKIYEDQMAFVQIDGASALIKFVFEDKKLSYEYRYADKHGVTKSGNGVAFEKYVMKEVEDGFELTDMGSKLEIICEKIKFEWSFNSTEAGFFYESKGMKISALSAEYFENADIARQFKNLETTQPKHR